MWSLNANVNRMVTWEQKKEREKRLKLCHEEYVQWLKIVISHSRKCDGTTYGLLSRRLFPESTLFHTRKKKKKNTKHYYKTTACVDGQKISQCSISFLNIMLWYLYSRGIIMAARAIKELKHTMKHAKRNETKRNENVGTTAPWPFYIFKTTRIDVLLHRNAQFSCVFHFIE